MSDWEKIGTFGVDSGQFWVGDPMWLEGGIEGRDHKKAAEEFAEGVIGTAGFGDGDYEVTARFVDVPRWGRRIAELRVVFITDEDLAKETAIALAKGAD